MASSIEPKRRPQSPMLVSYKFSWQYWDYI